MKTATPCPTHDQLQQLIEGSLPGEAQDTCTRHLDSCTCCQAKLEEIATGGSALSQVVAHLDRDEPGRTSAYWPALKSLDEQHRETQVARDTPPASPRTREVPLHFLQPAADSAYLGRIAHFDVMRVLGRGGMGVVLEAFDSHLQRNVALKVLDPDIADDETARQRFCREARAAASISHENVVAVHQVERAGEAQLPFLVMQLIAGESLEQRLSREGSLPLREIVRIGMQAAHGLAAAHAQGLIHRDIKPGNILLESSHDRVKLTDFGIARIADDVRLTSTGFVAGTPMYMSPEHALGEPTDARSDLFSLGAVLYEMCTGQPPFSGNSVLAIFKQISEGKYKPLKEVNPNVPDWLAFTVDRLLARKPEERIQTASQLAELFEFEWALMKTSSDDVPQVCEIEERRIARRNRWIAGAIAASFLALGMLGGWLLGGGRSAVAPSAAVASSAEPTAVLSANAGTVWSAAFDPTGKTLAMTVEDGSVRLWNLATKSVQSTFDAHRGTVWAVRYSHDGRYLVTAGDDGLIKVWDPAKGELVKSFQHPNAVRGLALSADDKLLIGGDRQGGLRLWSMESDEPLADTQEPGAVYAVALSPDGQTLATAGSDKIVRLLNADALSTRLPLEGHSGPVYALAFSPDGGRLASAGWDRTVRIWDTRSGQPVTNWPGHEGDIWAVAYSPDGQRLVTGGHDGAVKLWNAATGELVATYLGHKVAVHTVVFSQDGRQIASGGRDGAVRVWNVE